MSRHVTFGVPRVPEGALQREALAVQLGRSPLTVVRGPGGSGKTVLLSQWAVGSGASGVWITAEEKTGDRSSFWSTVADAAARVGHTVAIPDMDDGASDARMTRSDLVRAFLASAEPFTLIVDDAHKLRDARIAQDLLAILRASSFVRVLIGTRAVGPFEAPRETLTLDIATIGPDQLPLSLDEVAGVAEASGVSRMPVAELLELSGGSPQLLRALLSTAPARDARESAMSIVRDHLREIFGRMGADLASFAASSSIPDEFDPPLAEHLSGVDAGRTEPMLASLENEGLLTRNLTPDGPRFRFHPIVRDVLRDGLRREQPERYRRSSLVASAAAEADGFFLPALRHAVDAEDYSRASDVCLHGGFSLLRAGGAVAIVQRIPRRVVAMLPFLAIVLALGANARGERWKALELMLVALGASRASRGQQRVAVRAGLALVETVVLRLVGRIGDAVSAARRLADLLDESPAAELDEIAGQLDSYRLQAAISLFRGGFVLDARVAAQRAEASARAPRADDADSLTATFLLAAVDAVRGECSAAATRLDGLEAASVPLEVRNGYAGALGHLARGILDVENNDPDSAEREIETLEAHLNLEYAPLFTALRAIVWLWRGSPEVGLRLSETPDRADRPRARVSREDRRILAAVRVLLHASMGQMGRAHEIQSELIRNDPVSVVLDAELLLLEQRPDLVVARLSGLDVGIGPRLRAAADVLMACASLLSGDEDVAAAAMRRFLAARAVHGVASPFALIPVEHRPMLLALAERVGSPADGLARLQRTPAPFRTTLTRAALTPREFTVLDALQQSFTVSEIAASLGVAPNTVKSQLRTLYRKLGVSNRDEALRMAYLQGLLPLRDPDGTGPFGRTRG